MSITQGANWGVIGVQTGGLDAHAWLRGTGQDQKRNKRLDRVPGSYAERQKGTKKQGSGDTDAEHVNLIIDLGTPGSVWLSE